MLHKSRFSMNDVASVKDLIRRESWFTLVSHSPDNGLVASHYPVMLDESENDIVLLSHVGKPDEKIHGLGGSEVLAIVQGPHGYISPGWYDGGPNVPTWNFAVAHLYGTPEILSDDDNYQTLATMVDHFEQHLPTPFAMERDEANVAYAKRAVKGTVGLRLRVTRFTGKIKMSQDRSQETLGTIMDRLEQPGAYRNPTLAAYMRELHEG